MEEKVLVKSEQFKVKPLFITLLIISIVLCIIMFGCFYDIVETEWGGMYYSHYEHYSSFETTLENFGVYCIIPFGINLLLGIICYFWLYCGELTVTDKRIYGKVAWGKRVDLPIDSVSATGTIPLLKGVSVSTSSGRISFCAIKNTEDIYKVINNLLLDRQKKSNTEAVSVHGVDAADQLKKFKELLDSGVITQEEFEAKKKELLGL